MSTANQEHASLRIDGEPFEVTALEGREAISELFRYEVVCRAETSGRAPRDLIGAEASITLFDGFGQERPVHGIVAEAEQRAVEDGSAILRIEIRPHVWPLALGEGCRVFQDLTVQEIVEQVLAGAPPLARGRARGTVARRWELSATYARHVYCAQYREDDWAFISRMIEEEGIYCWFDHEADRSVLVFSDDSSRAPDLPGGARIAFGYESGQSRDRESFLELGQVTRFAPGKFSVASFSPSNPKLGVRGSHGRGALEVYRAEGGSTEDPAECERQARLAAEASAAAANRARGVTTSVRLVPGMVVDIEGHPIARLEGRYLVVGSAITVAQRRRGPSRGSLGEDRPCLGRVELVPADVPYRRGRVTPPGKQAGLQIGQVVGAAGAEIHPDAGGRVRVQYHWDREGQRDDKAGKWMRVAQRGTADSMLIPRIGWNVVTFNEEGEIDAPTVLSRLHDGEHPPAYALPDNKTRTVFKTATTPGGGSFNEIYFEDMDGREEMFINASKDMKALVQNDHDEQVQNDRERKIGHDHTFQIDHDYQDTVKRDQAVTIGHDESITVGGVVKKVITGNEDNVIGQRRTLKVGGKHTDQVQATRKLRVGAAQVDVTLGNIASTATDTSILVGGAMVRATASSMTEAGGWVSVQTIGGAKIETIKETRITTAGKGIYETAGGAMTITTASQLFDMAGTASWTVGGAMRKRAPVIVIEAKSKIVFSVGGTTMTITPDDITIATTDFTRNDAPAVVINAPKAYYN